MRLWLITDGITKKPIDAATSPENVETLCCAYGKSFRHELEFYINNGGNISVIRDDKLLFEVILMECNAVKMTHAEWGEGVIESGKSVSTLPRKSLVS